MRFLAKIQTARLQYYEKEDCLNFCIAKIYPFNRSHFLLLRKDFLLGKICVRLKKVNPGKTHSHPVSTSSECHNSCLLSFIVKAVDVSC